jgi:hypothetical protein
MMDRNEGEEAGREVVRRRAVVRRITERKEGES